MAGYVQVEMLCSVLFTYQVVGTAKVIHNSTIQWLRSQQWAPGTAPPTAACCRLLDPRMQLRATAPLSSTLQQCAPGAVPHTAAGCWRLCSTHVTRTSMSSVHNHHQVAHVQQELLSRCHTPESWALSILAQGAWATAMHIADTSAPPHWCLACCLLSPHESFPKPHA